MTLQLSSRSTPFCHPSSSRYALLISMTLAFWVFIPSILRELLFALVSSAPFQIFMVSAGAWRVTLKYLFHTSVSRGVVRLCLSFLIPLLHCTLFLPLIWRQEASWYPQKPASFYRTNAGSGMCVLNIDINFPQSKERKYRSKAYSQPPCTLLPSIIPGGSLCPLFAVARVS